MPARHAAGKDQARLGDSTLPRECRFCYVYRMRAHERNSGAPRIVSAILALLFPILAVSGQTAAFEPKWENSLELKTAYGSVRGKKDKDDTYAWLGIPYAAPPVGEFRWRAPQAPRSWTGVFEATRFGNRALQRRPVVGLIDGAEDCLYLNIWRPADEARDLPVYVWIHGGGNSSGASNAVPDYYGHAFASKARAVFVSINYRLGVFGWFSNPALREGADPDSASGNFGTLDIIQALKWIRQNIRAFGGDPDRVTIAGESAGAFNALTLLASPRATGLFHRAIVESGYRTATTKESAERFSNDFIAKLLVHEKVVADEREALAYMAKTPARDLAAWLRSVPASRIISLFSPSPSGMINFPYPIFDGDVLPAEGFDALAHPASNVPVLIGTNKEETKIFQWLGRENPRDPAYQPYAELASARWKADGADSIADAISSRPDSASVHVYRFDWGAFHPDGSSVLPEPVARRLGAFHSLEISFFLGTDSIQGNIIFFNRIITRENEAGRRALQAQMLSYARNLAWTGDPNTPPPWAAPISAEAPSSAILPHWDAWIATDTAPAFMRFDANLQTATSAIDHGRMTRQKVEELLAAYPEPLQARLREALRKSDH